MRRLIQLVVAVVFSLLFFMSAQASINVSIGNECAIFADEATDDSEKEGGDKKEGGGKKDGGDKTEEEEPDCD